MKTELQQIFQQKPQGFTQVLTHWVHEEDGLKKAAKIVYFLGQEYAANLLKQLDQKEVKIIIEEIIKIKPEDASLAQELIDQFIEQVKNQQALGVYFAKELLVKTMGSRSAEKIFNKIVLDKEKRGSFFSFLNYIHPNQLISLLNEEQPQTIALILSYLDTETSAALLARLPEDSRIEVASRIANMDQLSLDVIEEVENSVKDKIESLLPKEFAEIDGKRVLADILTKLDKKESRRVIDKLDSLNPKLVSEVKTLFVMFDDLQFLSDAEIKMVLSKTELKDVILALKLSSETLKNKILNNISEKARKAIKKEIETLFPVRIFQIEESKKRIAKILEQLVENEEIDLKRSVDA